GTTTEGGTNDYGMVFQITADGIFTNLFEFDGTNGAYPCDGLNFGTNGNLYGTTYSGGTNYDGTIFETTTNGILTNLVQFNGANGLLLYGGVFVDTNNNIYGTTYEGGANGYGTVFQLTANGQLTTLYSFTDGSDGGKPYAGVIRDAGGNLYGTTFQAGSHGSGTVFRVRDTAIPTLAITSPTANQHWSNDVFTATGTAKDNVNVEGVFCALNGSGWSNAVSANNWSNWTAQVTLTPGTNLVQAYSVDGAGNTSTSNNVAFDFVVTNQLRVIASGLGTISPDYSNAWLEVGRNYSMTATPASGFVVTNWVIATNQLSGRVTNNATVQFMMASNLILQVNFAEVTKPTLTIASPAAGQHMTNALATFAGTAKDNWGCSSVWYQLNNGMWSLAATGNGYTNWSATSTLVIGT
ncbi:MAG TPA: choice-of-anchor tandem repeat GloVer-containing protein, partial [Phycisphaerae bacterium]|nr:choice-of-anchor tandem repeat GloVer-containing protein [Phycisphaerae bacterium]